jgi:hypothetical protein
VGPVNLDSGDLDLLVNLDWGDLDLGCGDLLVGPENLDSGDIDLDFGFSFDMCSRIFIPILPSFLTQYPVVSLQICRPSSAFGLF